MTFTVGGQDFTEMLAYETPITFRTNDLHAEGSGRNPLDGLMEFVIVATKRDVTVKIRAGAEQSRYAALLAAIEANGRINNVTIFNPFSGTDESFTAYINKRESSMYGVEFGGSPLRQELEIHFVEM